jgi:hypothetical protein
MNARRVVVACALAAALAACSARPFQVSVPKSVTRAREAAVEAGRPAPKIISFCYGNLLNTPEEVLEEARYECRDGEVTFYDTDSFWTPCGLLQPVRASFICTPRPKAE